MAQPILFNAFTNDYLSLSRKSATYKQSIFNAVNHLRLFSVESQTPVYTNLNEQILENFAYYLREKNLRPSTVKNNVSRIKYLISKAQKAGYETDPAIDDFTIPEEEAATIFLTMREILKIHRYTNLTPREIEIKDYFIVGCLTALRFSDYSRLQPKNFVRNKIVIKTKKTNTPVQIPVHPIVREIIDKYNKQLPPAPSIQHFNREIKLICKKIGFSKKLLYERTIGHTRVSKLIPKYQFISSHTARRSAATNMYLSGILAFRIMLITGHKTEKSFFRYIRITREENVKVLARHKFFMGTKAKRKKHSKTYLAPNHT